MAAGDTYGASLAGSASSGAAQSGANNFKGGVALGPSYGPGSVVFGASPASTVSWIGIAIIATVFIAIASFIFYGFKKGHI